MTKKQTLKGFRDFLPSEAMKRQWLKNKIISVFEKWGYDPLETPTLEPLELFVGQIGEDEKLFFKFTDNGGRDVALRYDQTVPTCRVVGQYTNEITMPFKRYQIQPAFRAENTQKGRYREFIQCDADIFGSTSPLADAEVIALALDIYKSLGFKKAVVLVNDRSLLKDLPYDAIVAIDKLNKIGKDGVIEDMIKKGIDKKTAEKYFQTTQEIQPNETIMTIFEYLKNCGFDEDWYKFESTLARSFSYSTGPIWEVIIPDLDSGSVLGGERFDNLVEKISGKQIPGTGFGLGFDRTLEAATKLGLVPEFTTNTQILVTVMDEGILPLVISCANNLRKNGFNVELYPNTGKPLNKQLKYANDKGIPLVVLIGSNEINQGIITLKNMQTGEQKQLKNDDILSIAAYVNTSLQKG